MSTYSEYVTGKRREFGERFREPAGADHFGPYLHTGERVRVRFAYGREATGTIGVTTGWGPVFLLMRRCTSIGSSDTLGDQDRIVARQVGRKYVEIGR